MQKLKAIYTIIRLPNLIFIFLAQLIVHWKLVTFVEFNLQLESYISKFTIFEIIFLAISTTLIAAAGYIINDYFDVKIDEINKPNRVTVELQFKRRHIMFSHIILNIIALMIVVPIAFKAGHISLISIQLISILLLLLYSAYFKRKPVIGNIVVAFLSMLTVLTPGLYEHFTTHYSYLNQVIAIAFFAFFYTWLREIVKDLEDIKGDEADGCRTMPIVIGIAKSKYVLFTLSIISMIFCGYIFYCAFIKIKNLIQLFVLIHFASLLLFCILMFKANSHKHFKFLSRLLKIITFIGIIQIIFIS